MDPYGLLCPVCYQPLSEAEGIFRCPTNHTFDRAREGYVNLLIKTGQKQPGDDKAMVKARQSFLKAGYYQGLSDKLNALTRETLRTHAESLQHIVDVGCGEGYYLSRLSQALSKFDSEIRLSGFDISKWAVRKAALLDQSVQWFVADVNQRLLFPDESVSQLLNIFSPRNPQEFARVLTPGGILFCVIPSEEHLAVLRNILGVMDIEADKYAHTVSKFVPPLQLMEVVKVEYNLYIEDARHLNQLVQMTPFSRHLTEEKRALIQTLSPFQDKLSCLILMLQKP